MLEATLGVLFFTGIVLLLSLAAFGLLMGHYQDQVMQEVARTAEQISRSSPGRRIQRAVKRGRDRVMGSDASHASGGALTSTALRHGAWLHLNTFDIESS